MDGMADVSTRLNRVQGQVRGLQRMVREEAPCAEVLTQIAATRGALRAVALELLARHLRRLVEQAHDGGRQCDPGALADVEQAIARLART
jgi:DNA-binding FrmR family transcriptional regulator